MGQLEEAAAKVQTVMRALDAHRQDGAPSLEREYRRALEAYYVLSERALGRESAEESALGEDATDFEARAGELRTAYASILGHYAAARRALRLARVYREEPGTSGRRERECVRVALRHREAIRVIRMRARPQAEQLLLPGLAKTRPAVVAVPRVKSA
jgi:hypothetical protein